MLDLFLGIVLYFWRILHLTHKMDIYFRNSFFTCVAFGAAALGITAVAHAIPTVRISDGVNPAIVIADGGPRDGSVVAGVISFNEPVGNFIINFGSSLTMPAIGSVTNPSLLMTFNVFSVGIGGTLKIEFFADNFGLVAPGSLVADVVGATQGTVAYSTYGGTDNTPFSAANPLTTSGPLAGPAYLDTATSGIVNYLTPFGLTQVISINHGTGVLNTSGQASLHGVPDTGSALLLWGFALSFLALVSRRSKILC